MNYFTCTPDKINCVWEDSIRAFTYRLRYGLGFNDATNVAIMERKNISKLYSFDKVFDNVPWLKRDEA
ncbi:MAG: PIN domain-containing protein [Candidatus Bathyarchaeia archaeon]|nr:PIN domain-containing protein [Candidatus Bathyarchaeota archaeon]